MCTLHACVSRFALLAVLTLAAGSGTVQAQQNTIFENPIKYNNLGELLLGVLEGATIILLPIIALGIVYIGFQMVITGASKPEGFVKWRNSFMWALVGLFIVLGANGILRVIRSTVDDVLVHDVVPATQVLPHLVV